jgi:hypothetical protein
VSFVAAVLVLAGIVAKGLGVIAIIFAAGLVVGIILTVSVTKRLHR